MKRLILLSTILFATGSLFLTSAGAAGAASIVDEPVPLRIKVLTIDGKKKIKVKKKLPVLVACSKECSYKVTMTVVAPGGGDSDSLSGNLTAGGGLKVNYILSGEGLRYLRKYAAKSRLKVKFSAKDLETGQRVIKTRTYRLVK